ncbi:hypothetical protein FYK55_00940 [Roseiconus nitratireducens]|uniref:Uncharacterized protein n=1 Tax=Roseiconus nitratireducens TaxID=2605748 RepID=A0A5M6DKU4_9BACT|nr:hypothetical protein [Roseiconus nitratireducens]KAA5547016.1 hypothetical protein FYK55_00940 [Roseiconus nitratireducens]
MTGLLARLTDRQAAEQRKQERASQLAATQRDVVRRELIAMAKGQRSDEAAIEALVTSPEQLHRLLDRAKTAAELTVLAAARDEMKAEVDELVAERQSVNRTLTVRKTQHGYTEIDAEINRAWRDAESYTDLAAVGRWRTVLRAKEDLEDRHRYLMEITRRKQGKLGVLERQTELPWEPDSTSSLQPEQAFPLD